MLYTPAISRWCKAALVTGAHVLALVCSPPAHCEESYTNRLIDSNNPYLLLHAQNPVDWYPWGAEAFDKARRENKPIFLSIGYSTCYWCHVAERMVFSDPQIAKLMNQWFINVKVDREERPDLDAIYLLATQLITAGSGGWPNNLFLTPELAPFYAGGYFPPEDDDFGRPGFPTILRSIHEQWEQQPEVLRNRAQGVVAVLRQQQDKAIAGASAEPDPAAWRERTRASILRRFDQEHGGLSGPRQTTKFPEAPLLEFMLAEYRSSRNPDTLRFLTVTLDAMAYGGIYDQLGGGFHRYSTERTWSLPHFEKMLYDNAQLLSIYALAWEFTGRAQYKRVALAVRDYLRSEMMSAGGGFYTAQDAAVEGQEGASYTWTRKQIEELLGTDAKAFFETYALTVLAAENAALDPDDVPGVLRVQMHGTPDEREARLAALEPARRTLLAARKQRRQPPIDEKILAGLNGLAIEALITSARVFKTPEDINAARQAAQRLWDYAWNRSLSQLAHGLYRGRAQADGFLDDYALLLRGLLALHTQTRQAIWLQRGRAVADAMLRIFAAEGSGALRTTTSADGLILMPLEQGDGAYPAGISAAVDALIRLSEATHSKRYQLAAARIARSAAAQPERWPVIVAALNRASGAAGGSRPEGLAPTTASANDTAGHVRVSATVRSSFDGDEIAVTLRIDEGYHINANPASFDYLTATTLRLPGLPAAQIRYPSGALLKAKFAPEGIQVYAGGIEIVAQVPKGALADVAALRATIAAQACTETVCLPPSEIPVVVQVKR